MLVETKTGLKGRTDRRYVYNNGHEALLVEREWGYDDRGLELVVYQYNRPYSDEPLTYDYHIGLSEFEAQKILKEVRVGKNIILFQASLPNNSSLGTCTLLNRF